MATIIAGRFVQQAEAEHAARTLAQSGFDPDKISYFYTGPAGRHETYPAGGDHAESSGIHGKRGVAAGGAIGAVLGVAVAPLAGPAGAAGGAFLGAHVGSLMGTLSSTDEADDSQSPRQSGMITAVEIDDPTQEERAIEILQSLGAVDMERAQGHIEHGDWHDFDAVNPPALIEQRPH